MCPNAGRIRALARSGACSAQIGRFRSRQSDYIAMELLNTRGYVVRMVRIILIVALVLTMSLKHFEREPAYVIATPDSVSELTLASGLSATIVKATECDDKHQFAAHPMQSQKSDCKAVIGTVASRLPVAFDALLPTLGTSTVSAIRPVDLPPPRA